MKHSPANIIRNYVVKNHACSLPDTNGLWPGHVNFLADTVDNAILFTDTNGTKDGRLQRTGETIEHPGLQVLVRATDQGVAWQRIDVISKLFDATARQSLTIDGVSYLINSINRKGSIVPLSMEEHYKALEREVKETRNKRFIFVLNAIMTIDSEINYTMLPRSVAVPSPTTFWRTQVPAGVINGVNTIFTITSIGTPSIISLSIDGVIVTNFTIAGTTIAFLAAPTGTSMVLSYAT